MITEQMSMFDLLAPAESPFTSECRRGSGFENGKVRIYCASLNMGLKDFSEYLKHEYGIGGCSATFPDGRRGFTDYSPKGFVIREYKSQMEEKYSWLQVAKEIKRLILSGDYLSEKEKSQVMEACERNGGQAPVPKARMAI